MKFAELVATFGSAAQALDAAFAPSVRDDARRQAERALDDAERCVARLVLRGDDDYPRALLDLGDAPPFLFTSGDLSLLSRACVAIVGTRRCTQYAERVTREIAGALARAGVCVVSGMATGVDGVAHLAALESHGATAAVLGTGVNVAYPAAHRALHRRIGADGVLLSEHLPGERAHAGAFPRRNRIVAALAQATIVVEAGVKSGALITASHALDLGRSVAAVPGPIDVPQSAGSNELLRDGATVIASVADALALVGATAPVRRMPEMPPDERAVWDALGAGGLDADTLTVRSGLPAARCLAAITALEVAGAVECELTGEIRRR